MSHVAGLDGDMRMDIAFANVDGAPHERTGDATVTMLLQLVSGSFTGDNIPETIWGCRRNAL